ncbi:MAG: hypothetical protein WC979_01165 [Candidatus Pacearchaeota archaeon]|jgi:hypothetical protein|nr:hypothetical protein [Clostridia bacterium]
MNNLSGDFTQVAETLSTKFVKKNTVKVKKPEVIEETKMTPAELQKEVDNLINESLKLQESIEKLYANKTIPELYGASIYVGLSIKTLKTIN